MSEVKFTYRCRICDKTHIAGESHDCFKYTEAELQAAVEACTERCAQICRLYAKHQDPLCYTPEAYDAVEITCENLSEAIRKAGLNTGKEGE